MTRDVPGSVITRGATIGRFTISLFVASLAFRDSQLQAQAKLAILVASDTLLSRFP